MTVCCQFESFQLSRFSLSRDIIYAFHFIAKLLHLPVFLGVVPISGGYPQKSAPSFGGGADVVFDFFVVVFVRHVRDVEDVFEKLKEGFKDIAEKGCGDVFEKAKDVCKDTFGVV
jgi:hypothetical protein